MEGSVVKIAEGRKYRFLVVKTAAVPEKGDHFVLHGPDNRRYLIPVQNYKTYDLKTGDTVVCRVDKINCKGEVFLEPENPFYREGRRYKFIVSGYREIEGSRIRQGRVMVVRTVTGEEMPVPVPEKVKTPEPGSSVSLLVLKISKGRLNLAFARDECRIRHLDSDTDYEFVVEGTETDIDGEEYFVVSDQLGVIHTIRRKYYEYYGLKEGVRFRGKVVRYRGDGSRLIEPENPYYKKGDIVEISIARNERNSADGSYYIAGIDRFGFRHELRLENEVQGRGLKCRVVMIRKGKPMLEPLT
jgi:bifunctional DNA-binding transcriptional regulator/antitoxin component of YhaV-PrlF toxin-antitoxin module